MGAFSSLGEGMHLQLVPLKLKPQNGFSPWGCTFALCCYTCGLSLQAREVHFENAIRTE